jgi:hypothetical protein
MNPSLLLIPDRYKAAKLYSQIPDSGAGDLTFARNSNATRVNSAGLIEKVRENLVLNSATLATQDVTVTANEHTVSFFGTGSIVVSGVASGTLVGTGVGDRVELIFTATAGTLNLTVSGTVTNAQLEISDFGATPYIPTTTAAVSVGITADIPRLDYTGGGCPSLLLEPQRTNLALFSEQFNNAAWTKRANIGITANAIVSPDGTTNADKMAATDASAVDYGCFQIVASGLNTYSVFAKKAEMDYVFIGQNNNFASDGVFFNLNTGAISSNPSSYSATITNYGNGWYRCSVYFATNVDYFFISPSVNGTSFIFSGQSGNGIYIWGAQAEVGSYVSSYIPSLGSSVTRLADAASKTGISSLIGTEFTLFFDGFDTTGGVSTRYISLKGTGGTYANSIIIEAQNPNSIFVTVLNNSATTVYASSFGPVTNGQRIKVALRCKNNDFAFFVNGVLATFQTSGIVPTTSDLYLGYYIDYDDNFAKVNAAAIYPIGLSNADCLSLTAL